MKTGKTALVVLCLVVAALALRPDQDNLKEEDMDHEGAARVVAIEDRLWDRGTSPQQLQALLASLEPVTTDVRIELLKSAGRRPDELWHSAADPIIRFALSRGDDRLAKAIVEVFPDLS